jgi:hypothetical protein
MKAIMITEKPRPKVHNDQLKLDGITFDKPRNDNYRRYSEVKNIVSIKIQEQAKNEVLKGPT